MSEAESESQEEMTTISIPVTVQEREALRELARREIRDPRNQARYIIVQAIKQSQNNLKTS